MLGFPILVPYLDTLWRCVHKMKMKGIAKHLQTYVYASALSLVILSIVPTSLACALGPSVPMSSTDFSFQNLVFWDLFEFSAAEIT